MSNLAQALPRHLGVEDDAALEAALAAQLARARAAWPEVALAPDDVIGLAAERLTPGPTTALVAQIEQLRMADLYIAWGCAAGDPVALRAFESRYFPGLGAVLTRFGGESIADEVRQILREKLFVATPERRARILELAGKNDLAGLVRIAAVRTALNLRRADRNVETTEPDQLLNALALDTAAERRIDPASAQAVKQAFQDTVAALSARERNVLRLSLLHRLGIDAVGQIHGVHRATAARWLSDIRRKLGDGTRRRLAAQLALSADDADSLIRQVQSQIDVSFERILADA